MSGRIAAIIDVKEDDVSFSTLTAGFNPANLNNFENILAIFMR